MELSAGSLVCIVGASALKDGLCDFWRTCFGWDPIAGFEAGGSSARSCCRPGTPPR